MDWSTSQLLYIGQKTLLIWCFVRQLLSVINDTLFDINDNLWVYRAQNLLMMGRKTPPTSFFVCQSLSVITVTPSLFYGIYEDFGVLWTSRFAYDGLENSTNSDIVYYPFSMKIATTTYPFWRRQYPYQIRELRL